MIDNENTDKRGFAPDKEFADFIKDSRKKSILHELLAISAKSYIDGIQTALHSQQAAQAVTQYGHLNTRSKYD